jgi:hypothetical protein
VAGCVNFFNRISLGGFTIEIYKFFIVNFKVLITKIVEFWKNNQIWRFLNNQNNFFIFQKVVNKHLKMGFKNFVNSYCEPPYWTTNLIKSLLVGGLLVAKPPLPVWIKWRCLPERIWKTDPVTQFVALSFFELHMCFTTKRVGSHFQNAIQHVL